MRRAVPGCAVIHQPPTWPCQRRGGGLVLPLTATRLSTAVQNINGKQNTFHNQKNYLTSSPTADLMDNKYSLPDERINKFWHKTFKTASEGRILLKDLNLPLARIKRLMKVEEGVRMVASEVPVLFSIVTEKFIEELTLRAWIHTEENKRRILQKSDLTAAVKTSEMYDFLIYIIPKNDLPQGFNQVLSKEGQAFVPRRPDGQRMLMDTSMMDKGADPHHPRDFYIPAEIQKTVHGMHTEMGGHPENSIHPKNLHLDLDYERNYSMGYNRDINLDLPAERSRGPFN
jgi:nuclear transcription factor Y, gamma